ncbi:MAG: DUF4956 domain-containing protein [Christensenellales bacterium]|jgi:hypothetical protein
MNFPDIFKKAFLEGYAPADINAVNVSICLAITAAIGLYIFFVYRLLTRKTFYDKSLNISLPVLAVITAAIILAIQSSIVISLGMVGALSIVRFRTAIKNAMDLVFLFWAISVGIICGAGLAEIAVILSLGLTVGILILDFIPLAKASMLLVVNAESFDVEEEIVSLVKKHSKHYKIKARNLSAGSLDMIIEVRTREESVLVRGVMEVSGVSSASLVSHDGEVTF